jgi:hypothetical protein
MEHETVGNPNRRVLPLRFGWQLRNGQSATHDRLAGWCAGQFALRFLQQFRA